MSLAALLLLVRAAALRAAEDAKPVRLKVAVIRGTRLFPVMIMRSKGIADRILVFGPRPGRVKQETRVELPRPRNCENSRLFEIGVAVTRVVTQGAAS